MAQLIKIGIPRDQWDKDRTKNWVSDFWIGKHRINRALSKFKPEAQRMLNEMVRIAREQKHGDIVKNMSWPMFRETYLKESLIEAENGARSMGTYHHDHRAFELVDTVAQLNFIHQMTPERLARIKISLIEARDPDTRKPKYTAGTIIRAIRGIITAMRWAEDRKYVAMQNWRIVQKKNQEPEGRKDYFHRDDYLSLLSKLKGLAFTATLIMGRAGLRLGEALFLEWQDINFAHRFIQFRSKPHLGWKIKKDNKLKKVRMVPILTNDLWQHLKAIRKPSGFVLEVPGKRREDMFSRFMIDALEATGVKSDTGRLGYPHLLRHTFGSHQAQIGRPLTKIRDWMGHNSIRMTEGYSHLCPTDVQHDINLTDKLYSNYAENHKIDQNDTSVLPLVHRSDEASRAVLSTLDQENGCSDLSSEMRENS